MRILQLITQTVLGGAESYGFDLGAEFARRGHAVLLLGNRNNGPLLDRERPPGMEVDALARTSRLDPRILSFLVGSIRRFRPDLIHAHNFGAYTWARALGLLFPRLAVVCHVHSGRMVLGQPRQRDWIDRVLYRRADLVIVLNQEQRAYLLDRLRVPERKLEIIPNGIDTLRFAPSEDGGTRNPKEVVCVASLTEVKNHAVLLEAWARVRAREPAARLTLVGDGPLRPALEARAREADLAGSVAFAGLQRDVVPFLHRASVFVLASRREALPLSLLEAMAAGLVAVASRVGGIPEVVRDGQTGRLVAPGDPAELAAALEELLADPTRREAMGRKARAHVAAYYGLDPRADEIERAYRSALRRRRDS